MPERAARAARWPAALLVVALALTAGSALVLEQTTSSDPWLETPTQGQFDLRGSDEVHLPDCARVSIAWATAPHGPVVFLVSTGEAPLASDCGHTPAATASPPSQWPAPTCATPCASTGGGPFLRQNASQGAVSFVATQGVYDVSTENATTGGPSNLLVSVDVSYALPIVPASWILPALFGSALFGGLSVAAAVLTLRRRRRARP